MSKAVIVQWDRKRPKTALVIDIDDGSVKSFPMWIGGKSVAFAMEQEQEFVKYVNDLDTVAIINYKVYIDYFGACCAQAVYDYPVEYFEVKDCLRVVVDSKKSLFADWQALRADSVEVYKRIQDRGVYYEHKLVYPQYNNNTFSGRSKTTGFNIQGTNASYNIRHPQHKFNLFMSFDWIAADARIGAFLSEDEVLLKSFEKSDPYTYFMEELNNKIDRDKCKLEFNKAVNSLNFNSLVFKIFPRYGEWIKEKVNELKHKKFVKSIMGRKFYTDGSRDKNRRAFNGVLQGSVAHAMQASICRVERECGDVILTEQHDSLTTCTSDLRAMKDTKSIQQIMFDPLDGYLDQRPFMPLRVEVGRDWCDYKFLRELR